MNWLPFGYEKTYTLDIGSDSAIDKGNRLYIVKNNALSDPITENGETFRYLNGTTELVFNPKAVLKDALVNISVTGENVFVGGPIDFDYNDYDWDLFIDFSCFWLDIK